ncbi:hypothetical protein [Naasia lichenicola]|uniref:hypothetical protein n=1 Tax=Naasia lichenicola TaxID=2565933 RepID=UPI00130E25F8|nr:hypothetical protein [Naasia lichenicola]
MTMTLTVAGAIWAIGSLPLGITIAMMSRAGQLRELGRRPYREPAGRLIGGMLLN